MMGVLMALGWLLLTLLKIAGVLLLILLVLLALVLLCPLCADVCWEGGVLTVRAGALGLTLPVFQWPAPEKPAGSEEPKGFWGKLKAKLRARREERKRKKAVSGRQGIRNARGLCIVWIRIRLALWWQQSLHGLMTTCASRLENIQRFVGM